MTPTDRAYYDISLRIQSILKWEKDAAEGELNRVRHNTPKSPVPKKDMVEYLTARIEAIRAIEDKLN